MSKILIISILRKTAELKGGVRGANCEPRAVSGEVRGAGTSKGLEGCSAQISQIQISQIKKNQKAAQVRGRPEA